MAWLVNRFNVIAPASINGLRPAELHGVDKLAASALALISALAADAGGRIDVMADMRVGVSMPRASRRKAPLITVFGLMLHTLMPISDSAHHGGVRRNSRRSSSISRRFRGMRDK